MANVLSTEKQIAIVAALAEGSSIRAIERMTGVHRDTIMRLGVRIGQGCIRLTGDKMRDLPCTDIQLDEIWGFVGKKVEDFEAAVGLHFASYNCVKRHSTIRMTPAMALGIEKDFWPYGELVERAS